MQQTIDTLDDVPALPPELLTDTLPDKFCEACQQMIPAKFFLQRPRNRCKFCVAKAREIGRREHVEHAEQDERLAALQQEVKKDPINLPSVRDWLNELVVQDGGLQASAKKMLDCVQRVEDANKASRFPAEFRLSLIKLTVAMEAVESKNRAPEAPLPVTEARVLLERLTRIAMSRMSDEEQEQITLEAPLS